MSIRSEFLIAYDVGNNKKRSDLFKLLQSYSLFSIQKSVFWGFLTNAERSAISRYIANNLNKSDKCLITPITIDYKNWRTTCIGYDENDFQDWEEYGCL